MALYGRMYYRLILYSVILFLYSLPLKAQLNNDEESSLWKAFYDSSWSVVSSNKPSWRHDKAYPALWRAIGYAELMQRHYTLSADAYRHALSLNSFDTLSLITLGWNLSQMGENLMAGSLAKRLDLRQRALANISSPGFLRAADAEYSFKSPSIAERGNGQFLKLGFQTLIRPDFLWVNSFSSFSQNVYTSTQIALPPPRPGPPRPPTIITINDTLKIKQRQWYSALRYAPGSRLELQLPFNLIGTTIGDSTINGLSFGFLAGVRLSSFKFSAGAYWSGFNDSGFVQPSFSITHYPKHNADLYYGYKSCFIISSNRAPMINTIFLGGRMGKKVWMETFFLHGKFRNLIDQDGAYIYNTFDTGNWRAGFSVRLNIRGPVQPALSFSLDRFTGNTAGGNYFQRNITTTFTWKH